MKIVSITVISVGGTDAVYLNTDLPPSLWPYQNAPSLKLEVASEEGLKYAKENFPGVPIEVIRR